RVPRARQDKAAGIEMECPALPGSEARREHCLHTEGAGGGAFAPAARGEDQGEPRRESRTAPCSTDGLETVVEEDITEIGCRAGRTVGQVYHRNGVAELAALAPQRPFLGKGVNPVPGLTLPQKERDVLHHAGFLIVGLFNQETVVPNWLWLLS